jgi:hypothetical protein
MNLVVSAFTDARETKLIFFSKIKPEILIFNRETFLSPTLWFSPNVFSIYLFIFLHLTHTLFLFLNLMEPFSLFQSQEAKTIFSTSQNP